MAAIMADEEDVKMDDRLIMLNECLPLCRRTVAFGKLSMLVTSGNAFSMLDRSLKPVKGFSLVDSDCLLLREKMVALYKHLLF